MATRFSTARGNAVTKQNLSEDQRNSKRIQGKLVNRWQADKREKKFKGTFKAWCQEHPKAAEEAAAELGVDLPAGHDHPKKERARRPKAAPKDGPPQPPPPPPKVQRKIEEKVKAEASNEHDQGDEDDLFAWICS